MMTGEKNLFVLLVLTVGEEDEEDEKNEEGRGEARGILDDATCLGS